MGQASIRDLLGLCRWVVLPCLSGALSPCCSEPQGPAGLSWDPAHTAAWQVGHSWRSQAQGHPE